RIREKNRRKNESRMFRLKAAGISCFYAPETAGGRQEGKSEHKKRHAFLHIFFRVGLLNSQQLVRESNP
ncbi:MAG: hypothetical protein IIU47_10030, partial [Lachnospiraceae bacterium]|nr:hypothetical protein [Lachnospiraceae bacterium]